MLEFISDIIAQSEIIEAITGIKSQDVGVGLFGLPLLYLTIKLIKEILDWFYDEFYKIFFLFLKNLAVKSVVYIWREMRNIKNKLDKNNATSAFEKEIKDKAEERMKKEDERKAEVAKFLEDMNLNTSQNQEWTKNLMDV